jgi:hypothetical protein
MPAPLVMDVGIRHGRSRQSTPPRTSESWLFCFCHPQAWYTCRVQRKKSWPARDPKARRDPRKNINLGNKNNTMRLRKNPLGFGGLGSLGAQGIEVCTAARHGAQSQAGARVARPPKSSNPPSFHRPSPKLCDRRPRNQRHRMIEIRCSRQSTRCCPFFCLPCKLTWPCCGF